MKVFLFIFLTVSSLAFAQEQLTVRLNEQGLLKILRMAVKYNSSSASSRTVVIPQDLYQFTLKREQLVSNPIVPIVNEISNLNMNKDLTFYFQTSPLKINAQVDQKSLKATISNSHANGFDLKLSLNLDQISVTGPSMSLCEDRVRNAKRCGGGLKATISNLTLKTTNRPVVVTASLRLTVKNGVAKVKLLSVVSNLESSKYAPGLDINFSSVTIPKISIVINGHETELDTSRLRGEILERKAFFGKKLLGFAADFITSDLVEMINVYLVNTQVATTWQVYRKESNITFNEFLFNDDYAPARDNTYVRPAYEYPRVAVDNTYVHRPVIMPLKPAKDFMKIMMDQIAGIIRSAKVELSLKTIKTPSNKDVELAGIMNFVLNNRAYSVKNTLGNSSRTLPKLDLAPYRGNDINLAISEPVINGALDLVNSTGLFQELMDEVANVPGFSIKNVKLHFASANSLKTILNVQVDLKQLRASIWNNPGAWFKNKIASWLERNNNNGVIYFPIEVQVIPVVQKLSSGGVGLSLTVKSPFTTSGLVNSYKYPTNVDKMTDTVRSGIMDELKEALKDFINKTYSIDLSKFLNQSGVEFLPKGIAFNQNAYMILNLNITDIKFNSKNPNKK